MIGKNMSNVEAAADFKRPGAGGYIARIERVVNDEKKERLDLFFDIAEGEFAGYIKETNDKFGFWSAKATKSYKDTALSFFKAFIEAVIESNPDTDGLVIGDFEDIDETKLRGLIVGAAVGEREYDGNDGTRKRALDWYGANFMSADKIRSGDFEVPALRDTTQKNDGVKVTDPGEIKVTDATFGPVDDKDIPF